MDGKEAVRAHTLATSIFRHLASLQNEIPPLRAPQQSARQKQHTMKHNTEQQAETPHNEQKHRAMEHNTEQQAETPHNRVQYCTISGNSIQHRATGHNCPGRNDRVIAHEARAVTLAPL